MGLRIQNNIGAMNAHRQLGISDTNLTKSLSRLSSGYRINKAADDAAGLSIAQGFRTDIASFKVASRNAAESISMLQVAEGGAEQIGNMLVRLKELATQAASANASDNLTTINAEATAIKNEIDRIAQGTKYGTTALIDGTYGITIESTGANLTTGNGFSSISGMKSGYTYKINVDDTAGSDRNIQVTAYTAGGTTVGTDIVYGYTAATAGSTSKVSFNSLGISLTINSNISTNISAGAASTAESVVAGSNGNSTFQLGNKNTAATDQLTISLDGMETTDLGISSLSLSTSAGAQSALDLIDTATDSLTSSRGNIGAFQNRLSFASANLSSVIENVQAAESVIRDVDMAAEMTDFTKNQILLQAGTAMLAQANMAPQLVLQLLG